MKKASLTIILLFLAAGCSGGSQPQATAPISVVPTSTPPITSTSTEQSPAQLTEPISNALARATKVTFGLYVSPGHSPISPERFTGYHTGVDFETTAAEANIDVPIYAACNGKLLLKEYASGYGGVAAQSCVLDNNPVTIIYGHLRLSSIIPAVGQSLKAGDKIAVLGTGYSAETDGERKHLHFGIHKGTAVNILGYVQQQSQLSDWLNPLDYLR